MISTAASSYTALFATARVSFSGHREIYQGNGEQTDAHSPLIALMSLQLVIPGWVALQQSPLALHQPEP